jgi:hypothetical protein
MCFIYVSEFITIHLNIDIKLRELKQILFCSGGSIFFYYLYKLHKFSLLY